PGRGNLSTCSTSGAQVASAPTVAESSGPRRAASRATTNRPLAISKRRFGMSSWGTRSPARWSAGPSSAAVRGARTAAPMAASAACARVTLERPCHDLDPVPTQLLHRFLDRAWPHEAEVAVSWFDGLLSIQPGESGPVDIQLPIAEAIVAEPVVLLVNLSTK